LRQALDALRHRGPDQEGSWLGEQAMLGHRRLSIIDLSSNGRQPMSDPDGRIRVVFNGEIYNFARLRHQLSAKYPFRSKSDTEVLVHGYKEWGIEGLLERLSGMFAFAILDTDSGTLHLARDRVGEKPLYYAVNEDSIAFASTLPSLLTLLPGAPTINPDAVQQFLLYLCVPGEDSIVEEVRKLPPAHRAEFRQGRLHIHRYWSLSFREQEHRSERDWLELIDAGLSRAVESRLISDVNVGVFLSGGVDSSLVTALMTKASNTKVVTISAGFREDGFSELPHARRVAAHLGTDHHEHIVTVEDVAQLPRVVFVAGEPFGDHALLPTMCLARIAREHVTVVLTGDGGDEAFGGYPGPLLARLASLYSKVVPFDARRKVVPGLEAIAHVGITSTLVRRLRRLAVCARSREGFICEYDPLGERGFRSRLSSVLTADFRRRLRLPDADWYLRDAFAAADGPTNADRLLFTDLTTVLPDQFLVKTDVGTMAYGVEARSPFLDADLLSLTAKIPASVKTRGFRSKYLLKRLAERYVPAEVLYRRKQGFSVPMDAWMRGSLATSARALLLSNTCERRNIFDKTEVRKLIREHEMRTANHGQRLWLLLMLELWMEMFIDRSIQPSDELDVGKHVLAAV
jgi:asparagine synthase (glutamine-hydrolysing)